MSAGNLEAFGVIVRDIYYIQARLFNDCENYRCREGCSQLFLFTDKLLGKFEGIKEIRHFDLSDRNLIDYQEKSLELIANSLKVVNVSA
jgi:hypothetical protein